MCSANRVRRTWRVRMSIFRCLLISRRRSSLNCRHRRNRVNDASANRGAKIKAVFRVATGNFLEMYDFMVFGYYAAAIGRTFFPKSSEFAVLMLSFATFGVGFLIRPLGALVLGAYIDRRGRRAGLMLTFG